MTSSQTEAVAAATGTIGPGDGTIIDHSLCPFGLGIIGVVTPPTALPIP